MAYLFLIIGLALLVKAADFLIDGSTSLAKRFNVPSLIIGLTIVALGTSLPEFVINVISALNGSTQVAFGNVVGSNITNTLLILGVTALINPPRIAHSTVWREIPFSLIAAIVLLVVSNIPPIRAHGTFFLTRADGIVLYSFLLVFLCYLYRTALRNKADLVDEKIQMRGHERCSSLGLFSSRYKTLCLWLVDRLKLLFRTMVVFQLLF